MPKRPRTQTKPPPSPGEMLPPSGAQVAETRKTRGTRSTRATSAQQVVAASPTATSAVKTAQPQSVPTAKQAPIAQAKGRQAAARHAAVDSPDCTSEPIQPPKRRRRTKAEIEADKAEQVRAQAMAEVAEKRMKELLNEHAEDVRKKDRLMTEERQTRFIRQRMAKPVTSVRPGSEDEAEDFTEALENMTLESDFGEEELALGGTEQGLGSDLEESDNDIDEDPNFQNPQEAAQYYRSQMKLWQEKAMRGKGKQKKQVARPNAPRAAAHFATGLIEEYRSPPAREDGPVLAVSVNPIGGIGDDDIEDVRPKPGEFTSPRGTAGASLPPGSRNLHRKNTLVSVALPPTPAANLQATATTHSYPRVPRHADVFSVGTGPRQISRQPSTQSLKQTARHSSQQSLTPVHGTALRVHRQKSTSTLASSSDEDPREPSKQQTCAKRSGKGKGKLKPLTAGTVRTEDLPAFALAQKAWRTHFLPTLYDDLYHSSEPFTDFTVSTPKMTSKIQRIVDVVYPDVDHEVQLFGDSIHLLAYNRIQGRRGKIAEMALTLVSKHLKTFDSLEEAHEWLSWSRRLNGPLYYSNPTPSYCTAKPGDFGYIEPGGRLGSPFITSMVRNALDYSKNAVMQRRKFLPPLGLFGLVLASLERAANIMRADGTVSPKDKKEFSDLHSGEEVADWIGSLQGISEPKWLEILTSCSVSHLELPDTDKEAAQANIRRERRQMFTSESPQKQRHW